MQTLIFLLLVANLGLTAYLIFRDGRVHPVASLPSSSTSTSTLDRGRLLVVAVDRVPAGATRQDVESLLGLPANPNDVDWTYFVDRHSGYIVKFDQQDRLDSITTWKS